MFWEIYEHTSDFLGTIFCKSPLNWSLHITPQCTVRWKLSLLYQHQGSHFWFHKNGEWRPLISPLGWCRDSNAKMSRKESKRDREGKGERRGLKVHTGSCLCRFEDAPYLLDMWELPFWWRSRRKVGKLRKKTKVQRGKLTCEIRNMTPVN